MWYPRSIKILVSGGTDLELLQGKTAIVTGGTRTDMVAALPEEVANVFLFLASDLASYVTGTVVSVDGAAQT